MASQQDASTHDASLSPVVRSFFQIECCPDIMRGGYQAECESARSASAYAHICTKCPSSAPCEDVDPGVVAGGPSYKHPASSIVCRSDYMRVASTVLWSWDVPSPRMSLSVECCQPRQSLRHASDPLACGWGGGRRRSMSRVDRWLIPSRVGGATPKLHLALILLSLREALGTGEPRRGHLAVMTDAFAHVDQTTM